MKEIKFKIYGYQECQECGYRLSMSVSGFAQEEMGFWFRGEDKCQHCGRSEWKPIAIVQKLKKLNERV